MTSSGPRPCTASGPARRWWLEDAATIEAARAEQAEHTETVEDHPWFTLIEQWIKDEEKLVYAVAPQARLRVSDNSFVFTLGEVLERIGIPSDRWSDQRIVALIGKILRRMGWKSGGVRLVSDKDDAVRRWSREILTCNKRLDDGTRCSEPLDQDGQRCPVHGCGYRRMGRCDGRSERLVTALRPPKNGGFAGVTAVTPPEAFSNIL